MNRPGCRSQKNRVRAVSPARPGLAVRAACLLVAAVLLWQAPTAARAQEILVSSLDGSTAGTGTIHNYTIAQGFMTGPHSNGYDVTSVVLSTGTITGSPLASTAFRVTLRDSDSNGNPASDGIELVRVLPIRADSDNEFEVRSSEQARLQPDRAYWIVVEDRDGTLAGANWNITNASGTSNFGWETLAPTQFQTPGNAWTNAAAGFFYKLSISGTEATAPLPPGTPDTPVVDSRTRALEYNLASIGRTITATMVDHIWDRAARLEPGGNTTFAMVGGRVLDAGAFAESGNAQQMSRAIAGMLLGSAQGVPERVHATRGDADRSRDIRHALLPAGRVLLGQTRFALTSGDSADTIGSLAFWGRGDFTAFESGGDDTFPGFATEGEVVSGHVGIDYRASPQVLFGIAAGHARGETSHALAGSDDRDKLKTDLLSVHPYLYWTPAYSNRVWWGMMGYGSGDATLTEGAGRTKTDVSLRTFAGGVREAAHLGALEVAVKADAFLTELTAEGADSLGKTTGKASRVRAALEGAREWALDGADVLAGTVEIGLRADSRDAVAGKGADLAGKLHYASPRSGLDVTLRGSTLLTHEHDDYQEWGVGLLLVYDPGIPGRGIRLTLSPSWNTPQSGVAETRWNADSASGRAPADNGAALGIRLGYGMGALHDRARMTVYGEAGSDSDARRARLGTELRPTGAARFGLHVYGERLDRQAGGENALGLQFDLAF